MCLKLQSNQPTMLTAACFSQALHMQSVCFTFWVGFRCLVAACWLAPPASACAALLLASALRRLLLLLLPAAARVLALVLAPLR